MKLKKLAAYAKQNGKTAWLMTTRTYEGEPLRQYVYCGSGIYPIDGIGQLDAEMLKTVFDVTGDERSAWKIDEHELTERMRLMTEDNAKSDTAIRLIDLAIRCCGMNLAVLADEENRNVLFIDRDALKPVEDAEDCTLWLRKVDGGDVVVVKSGFMCVAAIGPYNASHMAEGLALASRKAEEQRRTWENEQGFGRTH